jgi:hypothetical protein
MGRARDISKVFSTNTALATDSEVSGSYLTQSSASTVYQTKAAAGLVLLNTTSFSGVASIPLPADTFTSTYDNYLIIFKLGAVTSDGGVVLKMRASGTDSSAGYYYSYTGLTSGNVGFTSAVSNAAGGFQLNEMDTGSSAKPTFVRIELYNPKVAEPTTMILQGSFSTVTGVPTAWSGGGVHTPSTAYDSVNFIASVGNITGSISVYGYNK